MKRELVVICHNLRSAYNVGSIFRTADGAGVSKIYLCGYTPSPPRNDIHKVALGAEESVPFEQKKSTLRLITSLKKEKYTIIALENNVRGAVDYRRFRLTGPAAIILGSEVEGLERSVVSRADTILQIPMRGTKESLNVSVAFGIAAYALLPNE